VLRIGHVQNSSVEDFSQVRHRLRRESIGCVHRCVRKGQSPCGTKDDAQSLSAYSLRVALDKGVRVQCDSSPRFVSK
jgi:hypothetical protein